MNKIPFPVNSNFILVNEGWGNASGEEITSLLDWIVSDFITVLNSNEFTKIKPVFIKNRSLTHAPDGPPMYQKFPTFNLILLATTDRYWCQYSYQFIHELLHHVIDVEGTEYLFINQFGWLEESLCELASIAFMDRMANRWITNQPLGHFPRYAHSIADYIKKHLAEMQTPEVSFDTWLTSNITDLYQKPYNRAKNKIVAYQLFPVFKNDLTLWRSVLYLKDVRVTQEMELNTFLIEWQNSLPSELKMKFEEVKKVLFLF